MTVTFEVASGGGNVVGSRQITDATGLASVGGWFLGSLPGSQHAARNGFRTCTRHLHRDRHGGRSRLHGRGVPDHPDRAGRDQRQ